MAAQYMTMLKIVQEAQLSLARVGRPYRLCLEASVRLPVAERKRCPRGDYISIDAMLTLLSNATINARIL